MATGRLLITKYSGNTVCMLIGSDGRTEEIIPDNDSDKSLIGNIYAGNVTNIVKGIGGAFVEFAPGRMGFLKINEKTKPVYLNPLRMPGPVRQGDIILVQAENDAIKLKETTLTAKLRIPGRYVVLLAGEKGVRFSSKFKDKTAGNKILEALPKTGEFGFIIRTGAKTADSETVAKDAERCIKIYEDVLAKAKDMKKGLVLKGDGPVISKVRDLDVQRTGEIVTDDTESFLTIKEYLEKNYPEEIERLRIYNDIKAPFKVVYGIESRIRDALNRKVLLRSGGFLIIEPTEAMVVIDVNSGKQSTDKKNDFFEINMEAAKEIARQIKLRNLSGIIIVDFINMKNPEHKELLLAEMRELLKDDGQRSKVVDMTELGLVEITRKKVRRPLYETMNF